MNSIFHIQSSIINQMLCIYFRIDISDKIISELIFQTRRISTRMVLCMFFHYRCIVETQETFLQQEIFLDKEYYNNHYPNIFSVWVERRSGNRDALKILLPNPNLSAAIDSWRSGYRDDSKTFFLNPNRFPVNVGRRSWNGDALNIFIAMADLSTFCS